MWFLIVTFVSSSAQRQDVCDRYAFPLDDIKSKYRDFCSSALGLSAIFRSSSAFDLPAISRSSNAYSHSGIFRSSRAFGHSGISRSSSSFCLSTIFRRSSTFAFRPSSGALALSASQPSLGARAFSASLPFFRCCRAVRHSGIFRSPSAFGQSSIFRSSSAFDLPVISRSSSALCFSTIFSAENPHLKGGDCLFIQGSRLTTDYFIVRTSTTAPRAVNWDYRMYFRDSAGERCDRDFSTTIRGQNNQKSQSTIRRDYKKVLSISLSQNKATLPDSYTNAFRGRTKNRILQGTGTRDDKSDLNSRMVSSISRLTSQLSRELRHHKSNYESKKVRMSSRVRVDSPIGEPNKFHYSRGYVQGAPHFCYISPPKRSNSNGSCKIHETLVQKERYFQDDGRIQRETGSETMQ
ncbi:unnamed protein product [Nesidiocoris tenuis]|uniref:Uncharacterized protein n=1 Tax=Nesidiocoris tenuis TaxID=355587 RepID=A0A6H5H892_9HEMI|nr:unnamed protein product [Nesidiocoris tenuis]